MDRSLRNALIAGIFVVSLSVAYYLVIFIPQREASRVQQANEKQSLEEQRKKEQAANLNNCISDVSKKWTNSNLSLLQAYHAGQIGDPTITLQENEKRMQLDKADCFKKYPQ